MILYGGHFDIDLRIDELNKKTEEMNKPGFWDNKEQADLTLKDISELKKLTQDIQKLKEDNQNNLEISELLLVEKDEILIHNLEEDVQKETKELEKISLLLLLSGEYDIPQSVISNIEKGTKDLNRHFTKTISRWQLLKKIQHY